MIVPKAKRLPSGSWNISLCLGGRRVSITEPTEKRCKRKAEMMKAEYRNGKRWNGSHDTVRSILNAYIEKRRPIRSPSTIRGYLYSRDNHFRAAADREPQNVNWQAEINKDLQTYAPKSVALAWSFYKSAMREAGYEPPRVLLPQAEYKVTPWLTDEQIPLFLREIEGDICEVAALLALHSLRMSEILGLNWESVNLKDRTITVEGAVIKDEHNKSVRVERNKTAKSRRTIRIMIPRLFELLSASPEKSGAVVPWRNSTIFNHIRAACDRAGLPRVPPHGMRHSFASLAMHLGMTELETMEIGGWSNPATMHKIYQHISAKDRLAAENKMSAFYEKCR